MSDKTAMPSRKHPEHPKGISYSQYDAGDGDLFHDEGEETHPGWTHHYFKSHNGPHEPPYHGSNVAGTIFYSKTKEGDPAHPALTIHDMKVYPGNEGKGYASAMQDELRRRHPEHMFDHGGRSPAGQKWWDSYSDPGDPRLNLEHPDNAHLHDHYRPTQLQRDLAQSTFYRQSKLNPEPGAMLRTAARDKDFGFHVTASWADVQRKAKRIRSEGGVTIVVASADGIGGEVRGDHGTYEALLVYRPGTRKVADWTCGCKWAAYAFERSPGFKHFEGRKCSHALALQFEAQSQGMFGKEVHPSESSGARTITRYDPDTGEHVFARPYAGSLVGSLVARLRAEDVDPAEIIGGLMQAGMPHAAALKTYKTAGTWHGGDVPAEWEKHSDQSGYFHHPIHRGMRLYLDEHTHDVVHDESRPMHERAHALLSHIKEQRPGLGFHWTDDVGHARNIANSGGWRGSFRAQPRDDNPWGTHTDVMIHAAPPHVDHIEKDPKVLRSHNTTRYGDFTGEGEIPLKSGAPVHVTGISWDTGDRPRNSNWMRHNFDETQHHTAGMIQVTAEHGEGGEHHCPHCGAFLGVAAFEHHHCPHCGAPLGGEAHHHGRLDASVPDLGMVDGGQLGEVLAAKTEDHPGPKVSGIALKAHDTGRVLMLQRGLDDPDDPAAGTWEFPGGHHEDGDLTSLHAAIREWEEEVGQEFPLHGTVKHTWTSPNGTYQGHVVVIPSEKDLVMKDGRVTVNPDDPKGDCHEQACWWDVEHARKNPALRAEVKDNTPWKDIDKASLETAKTASAWDPISNTNPQPGRGMSEPAHSTSTNPASTGFATSEDPDNWDNITADPSPLIPSLSFDSVLHDGPEPALPTTYGDDDRMDPLPPGTPSPTSDTETMKHGYDDLSEFREDHPEVYASQRPAEFSQADLDPVPDNPATPAHLVPDQDADISLLQGGQVTPNMYHASATEGEQVTDIIARFQRTAAGQELAQAVSGGDAEIAAAAQAHLEKTAAAKFDFAEQQELIGEGAADGRRARNLGDLKIEGTHYALLDEALAQQQGAHDLFI